MDFLHSKAKQFSIETVSSLPTGLGTAQRGRLVIYKGVLFWWDGNVWISVGRKPIYTLTELVGAGATYETDADYSLCDNNIDAVYWRDYVRTIGRNDKKGTIGTINWIGRFNQPAGDTALWNGMRVIVTAKDETWFNLGNDVSVPTFLNEIAFPILTGTANTIWRVKKAEFIFDANVGKWQLYSYERATFSVRIWFYPVETTQTIINKTFSLPYPGAYQFDVFAKVRELDAQFNEVPVLTSRMLEIFSSLDNPITIYYGDQGGIFERSMNGGGIIRSAGRDDTIYLRFTLPNGTYKHIDYGYIHLQLLEKEVDNEFYI